MTSKSLWTTAISCYGSLEMLARLPTIGRHGVDVEGRIRSPRSDPAMQGLVHCHNRYASFYSTRSTSRRKKKPRRTNERTNTHAHRRLRNLYTAASSSHVSLSSSFPSSALLNPSFLKAVSPASSISSTGTIPFFLSIFSSSSSV